MKKMIVIAAIAATALGMTGCSKDDPSAIEQAENATAEAAEAVADGVKASESAAKELAKELESELD